MKGAALDLDTIKSALADEAEAVLLALFGDPTTRTRREWRWGRKGSVVYRFDRGTFRNFEADAGGSLLDAAMFANGCSFPAAVTWAKQWLGLAGDSRPREKRATCAPERRAYDADAEQQQAIAEAVAMWRAGRRIEGTAGARYLQGRAIDGWPADCVRLIAARDVARLATSPPDQGDKRKGWIWWRWPALMFPLSNKAGDVTAVQLIALQDDGRAVPHWEHDGKIKVSRGLVKGSALRLPGDPGPLVIAEGGEDALSIWLATGRKTWGAMGNIGHAPVDDLPKDEVIVAAIDDDPPRSPARKALHKRLAGWRDAGRRVLVAQPWPLSRGDKSDFNDVLQADGPDAVRERIDAALRPQETTQGAPKKDAQLQLSTAVGRAVADCLACPGDGETPAPFKVIRATLGLGKSEAALEAILSAIEAGHRVAYSGPAHELLAELAERMAALADKRGRRVNVRVWHGRDRENPDAPGQTMCRDTTAAELARRAGINVAETVCNAPCQFREGCSYLAQREAKADLWLVPHALLFAALPAAMSGVSLLVIDEGFSLAGMVGLDGPALLVPFAALRDHVTHGNGNALASADLDATLRPLRLQLLDALADHPTSEHGEPLQRAALMAAGLTVEDATTARKAEGKRRRDVSTLAATRADLLRELRLIASTNSAAKRAAMLWQHVGDLLADGGPEASGRVELVTVDGERAFRLYGLATMGKGWRALPTLHLDATADLDLIRARVGSSAELVANVEASEPHAQVHQIVGRVFGKGALHGGAGDDARRFALATAAEHGGRWLVVASKGAADGWRDGLPGNVSVAHWGAVRGLDSFNDVRGLVCVGRWGVPPHAVERMAGVLTGRAIGRVSGGYPLAAVTLTAADGNARTVEAERHPDPMAEAVRVALVEAELVQAMGRGRGVRRHAGNPLAIYVLGNTPLPCPLATISDWQPLGPDREMLADLGAWLQSTGDAAEAWGRKANTVKVARQRLGYSPYSKILLGPYPNLDGLDGLAVATYQRAGAGRSEVRMLYSPDRIPDPRAWLEAKFGPLVHFEAERAPAEAPAEQQAPAATPAAQNSRETAPPPPPMPAPFAMMPPRGFRAALGSVEPVEAMDPPKGAGPEFSGAVKGGVLGDLWADYAGGLMSPEQAAFVRATRRGAGITQERLAALMDLSRPQLANALAGRFGLSRDAADRLRATLAELPQPQGSFL